MDLSFPLLVAFGIGGIGPSELLVLGVIAVLLFGSRLPEVGKQIGKSFVEFKKGLRGIQGDFHAAMNEVTGSTPSYSTPARQQSASRYSPIDDRDEAVAPKFEPPRNEPQDA